MKEDGYLLSHWHGKHSLARSYWINYWLLSFFIGVASTAAIASSESIDPVFYARLALLIILISYLVIYPWQVIGLWRSANNTVMETGKTFWPGVVKFIVVIGFIGGIAAEVQDKSTYNTLYYYAFELSKSKNYNVEVDDGVIYITGDFDYGLSDNVEKILEEDESIEYVSLDSSGGLLYEAYKLSDLILLNSLNTYTTDGCYSACTIAFISGNKRYIYEDAQLGFHQYEMIMSDARLDKEAIKELVSDQERDAKFFQKRGVGKEFTDRMYQLKPDDMWYPKMYELEHYGVVHSIIEK